MDVREEIPVRELIGRFDLHRMPRDKIVLAGEPF
jgi:hypothetical protein